MKKKPKICIAPLDWGLGHATRIIPLAEQFLNHQFEVFFAGNQPVLDILSNAFPECPLIEIPGYEPRYGKFGSMIFQMGLQTPRLFKLIAREQKIAEELQKKHNWDVIISDNRYAFRAKAAYNILITHQLKILMPDHGFLFQPIIDSINNNFINRFDECWIPDNQGINNLAGKLSQHTQDIKIPVTYIGPLSRFDHTAFKEKSNSPEKIRLLGIVSGPEPQRNIFLEILVNQLSKLPYKSVVAGGSHNEQSRTSGNCEVIGFMDQHALFKQLHHADIVISRPGYSTIMDLQGSGKKAIFIPTPGQTEQLYLAKKLASEKIAPYYAQHKLNLETAIMSIKSYIGFKSKITTESNSLNIKIKHLTKQIFF